MWFTNENPALRACWHPVAYRHDLDRAGGGPVRVELLGEAWALALVDGRPVALRDECAHRLAPLSAGELVGGCFRCPYHGWSYDTGGALVDVPALGPGATLPVRARLDRPAALAERHGIVWMAVEPPVTPLPEIPEIDDPGFTVVPLDPWEWEVSAAQMADNFLDVAHFPFVHTGTFGDPDDLLVSPYEVERHGWTFEVVHRHSTKALADSADPSAGYAVHERGNHFVFTAPHHVYLRIDYEAEGVVLVIVFFHQPIDATRTRVFCMDLRNDLGTGPADVSAEAAAAFQLAVGREDKALLEQLRHKGVSLAPGVEAHTRADRITVELRRVLADLVAETGAPLAERPPTTGPWRPVPTSGPSPMGARTIGPTEVAESTGGSRVLDGTPADPTPAPA